MASYVASDAVSSGAFVAFYVALLFQETVCCSLPCPQMALKWAQLVAAQAV